MLRELTRRIFKAIRRGATPVVLGISLVVIAGLLAFAVTTTRTSRESTLSAETDNLDNLSLSLAQHLQRVMFGTDLVVASLEDEIEQIGIQTPQEMYGRVSTRAMYQHLQDLMIHSTDIDSIGFADASGRTVSSRVWPTPSTNISDREYFVALRNGAAQAVSRPIKSKLTGQEIFVLARRIESKEGEFIGIVYASISTHRFAKLFADVLRGDGMRMFLFQRDGQVLAEQPRAENGDAQAAAVWRFAGSEMARADQAHMRLMDFSAAGEPQLLSLRTISGYPLVIVITRLESQVLSQWQKLSRLIYAFTTAAILMVMLSAYAFFRLSKARTQLAGYAHDLATSNKDLAVINRRLTETQEYAQLGQWETDMALNKRVWSDELYRILEVPNTGHDADFENFLSIIHPEDRAAFDEAFATSVQSRAPFEHSYRLLMRDGRVKFVMTRGRTVYDGTGKAIFSTGSLQDITALKTVEEELRIARDVAETANRAKSEFLSSMSHELRTPMNAILGFTQLLEMDGGLSEAQQESVSEIHNAGQHLLTLINDLLDLARIDSGKVSVSLEPVELGALFDECGSLIKPFANTRGISVHSDAWSNIWVIADRVRLKQVLLNLISNAIKYNRVNGSMRLSWQRVRPGCLRIVVTDTGLGIPAARINDLFQPFSRLGAENSAVEGTGIGLSITRKLVELMGGQVGVESTPGLGSSF